MALVRCTCVYGARPGEPDSPHGTRFTVVARDPWCPADAVHAEVAKNTDPDASS